MSSNPKVSVVIPVYNTAPYLRQCLDSVVNQTLRDIEIICVDDGSTDGSDAILEEYAAADPRIRILHQQNQYAGVARNNGMAVATGKYLMFWDSDDYFDVTALEKMYNQSEADQADICVCGGKRFYEDLGLEVEYDEIKKSRIPDTVPFDRISNSDYILNFVNETTWNKLFLRAFVERYDLRFQATRNGNDAFFVANALCLADIITLRNEPLVCYRKNQTSSLMGTLEKRPLSLLKNWAAIGESLKARDVYPERSFRNKALVIVIDTFHSVSSWDSFLECFQWLRDDGIEALDLVVEAEGYYYPDWHAEFLQKLLDSTPEDFLAYSAHLSHVLRVRGTARRLSVRQKLRYQRKETTAQRKRADGLARKLEQQSRGVKPLVSRLSNHLRRIPKLFSS